MSFIHNQNKTVSLIKSLIDGIRCVICDSSSGDRFRYCCGHTACSNCVETADHCLLCLTPTDKPRRPVHDTCLSERVTNVLDLLQSYQEAFHIDVDKSHRLSEQLKKEKKIFPECIQVSNIYQNKKKSLVKTKEKRHCVFPGEEISNTDNTMNSSKGYVSDWLDQHESKLFEYNPRKPFADLDINSPNKTSTPIKRNVLTPAKREKENYRLLNKTSTHKLQQKKKKIVNTEITKLSTKRVSSGWKSVQRLEENFDDFQSKRQKKNEKDESGIEVDEPILLDDSQDSRTFDKDKLAWLAVVNANEKECLSLNSSASLPLVCKSINHTNDNYDTIKKQNTLSSQHNLKKVLFYKKGCISETCKKCNTTINKKSIYYQNKDVSITMETKSLITNITISKCSTENKCAYKNSKACQTEFNLRNSQVNYNTKSQCAFSGEVNPEASIKTSSKIVIDSSSSDSEHELSGTIVVPVDVHLAKNSNICNRSNRILKSIGVSEVTTLKPVKRAYSPDSNNSSDKENFDPNCSRRTNNKFKKKKIGHLSPLKSSNRFLK